MIDREAYPCFSGYETEWSTITVWSSTIWCGVQSTIQANALSRLLPTGSGWSSSPLFVLQKPDACFDEGIRNVLPAWFVQRSLDADLQGLRSVALNACNSPAVDRWRCVLALRLLVPGPPLSAAVRLTRYRFYAGTDTRTTQPMLKLHHPQLHMSSNNCDCIWWRFRRTLPTERYKGLAAKSDSTDGDDAKLVSLL